MQNLLTNELHSINGGTITKIREDERSPSKIQTAADKISSSDSSTASLLAEMIGPTPQGGGVIMATGGGTAGWPMLIK